jgi:hypothetical protein
MCGVLTAAQPPAFMFALQPLTSRSARGPDRLDDAREALVELAADLTLPGVGRIVERTTAVAVSALP